MQAEPVSDIKIHGSHLGDPKSAFARNISNIQSSGKTRKFSDVICDCGRHVGIEVPAYPAFMVETVGGSQYPWETPPQLVYRVAKFTDSQSDIDGLGPVAQPP